MIKAGQIGMQTAHPNPGTYQISTTHDVNRLCEMLALFAWRRRCYVRQIDVTYDARFKFTTARVTIVEGNHAP